MEILAVLLMGFLTVGGAVGGILLVMDSSGAKLKLSTDLLKHAPVDDYFWPGIFLLLIMSVWPAINILLLFIDIAWADKSVILLGAACMIWIIYQIYTIRHFWFLQPMIFGLGALLIITQL